MKVKMPLKKKSRIEMLPLIDVVFLLLVVFIYTMLSMAVHKGLPVSLPESSSAEIEQQIMLSVTIQEDGSVHVDKEPVAPGKLAEYLETRAADQANPGVLLFADQSVSYQELFQVLDQIKMAGLSKISLQAREDDSAPDH
ncbi:MAG: biopolymer transporter ExbD [Desulfosudaceae bacterium]